MRRTSRIFFSPAMAAMVVMCVGKREELGRLNEKEILQGNDRRGTILCTRVEVYQRMAVWMWSCDEG